MKSGLYACIDLTGAPPTPHEAVVLGLDPVSDIPARGVDLLMPHCVDVARTGDSLCILVGRIDDDDGSLHGPLGLRQGTPAATVARAALERWGDDVAAHLHGEWSCLLWDGAQRRLRLASAMMQRDPVFYRIDGSRITVAPSIATFRRLGGNNAVLDEEALLLAFARPGLRRSMQDRTILRGVRRVRAGTVATIDALGDAQVAARPMLTAFDWSGDIDAAIAEVTRSMRAGLRRRMAGHDRIMGLISGGLDSSIVAWLAAEARQAGQTLTLLSSVSPPGSGIADECAFSGIVARHLDLPIVWIAPDADASVYRPSRSALEQADGPLAGPRHYLYDALHAAALADGSTLLLDGVGGEMTVTGDHPVAPLRTRLRRAVKGLLRRDPGPDDSGWPQAAFHPKLAAHRLAALPDSLHRLWQQPDPPAATPHSGDRWGFYPGADKLMRMTTELVNGRLRADYPFRDAALLRRFASFPAAYTRHAGLDRAFGRMLLAGHLPDAIRLRPKGSGFSPDYEDRLHRQAAGQCARIALLRKAGVDDWIDLDWLDDALQRIAIGGPRAVADPVQVQSTALAAEYLYWWSDPSGE